MIKTTVNSEMKQLPRFRGETTIALQSFCSLVLKFAKAKWNEEDIKKNSCKVILHVENVYSTSHVADP